MAERILGSSGVETGISSGRPKEVLPQATTQKEREQKAQQRVRQANLDAASMLAVLAGNNNYLKGWMIKYINRLIELAQTDPICQGLEIAIDMIHDVTELRPQLAAIRARQVLGPQLTAIADQEETQAAP